LVATSMADYEALALRLAKEPGTLANLRQKLAYNRTTAPLFDIARYTENLEAAYTQMWEIWQCGEAPKAFAVNASFVHR